MGNLTKFIDDQKAFNARQATAIDQINTSLTGLTGDIDALNQKIQDLQNSPGQITPEDQAALDEIVAASSALADKSEAVGAALAALDAMTPPPVPAP